MIEEAKEDLLWFCSRCNEKLVLAKVKLSYLSKDFETELMRCPVCGSVLIGEDLAMGKVLEVERALEDK